MSNKSREAKIRLTADFINRTGINSVAIGAIAPVAGLVFTAGEIRVGFDTLAVGGVMFFIAGIVLHLIARQILNGLDK